MWISQAIKNNTQTAILDIAIVSKIENGKIQAVGNNKYDNIIVISAFQSHAIPQIGDTVILFSPNQGDPICLGTLLTPNETTAGEIKFVSKGGASIHLKNNGDITLNGVTITSNGTIKGGKLT